MIKFTTTYLSHGSHFFAEVYKVLPNGEKHGQFKSYSHPLAKRVGDLMSCAIINEGDRVQNEYVHSFTATVTPDNIDRALHLLNEYAALDLEGHSYFGKTDGIMKHYQKNLNHNHDNQKQNNNNPVVDSIYTYKDGRRNGKSFIFRRGKLTEVQDWKDGKQSGETERYTIIEGNSVLNYRHYSNAQDFYQESWDAETGIRLSYTHLTRDHFGKEIAGRVFTEVSKEALLISVLPEEKGRTKNWHWKDTNHFTSSSLQRSCWWLASSIAVVVISVLYFYW